MKKGTQVVSPRTRRLGVAEAKSKLSEVLREAALGPTVIHSRGRDLVVVLAVEDYERLTAAQHLPGAGGAAFLQRVEALKQWHGGASVTSSLLASISCQPSPSREKERDVGKRLLSAPPVSSDGSPGASRGNPRGRRISRTSQGNPWLRQKLPLARRKRAEGDLYWISKVMRPERSPGGKLPPSSTSYPSWATPPLPPFTRTRTQLPPEPVIWILSRPAAT
jgi:prevent-host-death family protein